MRFAKFSLTWKMGIGLVAVFASLPLIYAQRPEESHGESARGAEPARAPVARQAPVVDRSTHGSIRHVDTHVVERPAVVNRQVDVRHDVNVRPEVNVRNNVIVHRDVEVDVDRSHFWGGFTFGRRIGALRAGYLRILIGGRPFFYDDGIYYQQVGSDYEEIYPPVGADIPDLPDGAVEIDAGGVAYYYAGGAFYVQQDGGYVTAAAPMGVTVPELPPSAVTVSHNGGVAYQFNGIYYEPVFVNGVTQYMTFTP